MAFLNQIETSHPPNQVHQHFLSWVPQLVGDSRKVRLFERMVKKSLIEKRYCVLKPDPTREYIDETKYLSPGRFPTTEKRMQLFEEHALETCRPALDSIFKRTSTESITHVIVTTCTGFYAPGLDWQIVKEFGLSPTVERTVIGFMGCFAAFNAMKLANQIVAADEKSKVLIVNAELCTLHFKESDDLEDLMAYLIFADGAAASIVSSEEQGIELRSFYNDIVFEGEKDITWKIADGGFNMYLSPKVPQVIKNHFPKTIAEKLKIEPTLFAIHPGGRAIIEAVGNALELADNDLQDSFHVLKNYGNMSSATIMFVLERILKDVQKVGEGLATAFGPGLTVEAMGFRKAPI